MSGTGSGVTQGRFHAAATIRGICARGTVTQNTSQSRWKCRACGSHRVQIRLPVWFTEYADGSLVQVNVDEEADPEHWYCERCFACELGSPVLVEDGEAPPPTDCEPADSPAPIAGGSP
jgi:hypothetical protein